MDRLRPARPLASRAALVAAALVAFLLLVPPAGAGRTPGTVPAPAGTDPAIRAVADAPDAGGGAFREPPFGTVPGFRLAADEEPGPGRQDPPPPAATGGGTAAVDTLLAEAYQHWDTGAYDEAILSFREALALEPRGETFRALGWLYAERDRHEEAIAAFAAAVAADPSLEPELRFETAEQLLWAERTAEAIPLLESVRASRPRDPEAGRRLALAYRWADRHRDAERVYRELLADDPADREAQAGLAESLLWQGRLVEAEDAFSRSLESDPKDPEALVGRSRARLFMDRPDEAGDDARAALAASPGDPEALAQERRVRRRAGRALTGGYGVSHDSDDLTISSVDAGVEGRPARGVDLAATVKRLWFRQGSPGKTENIGDRDQAEGTGAEIAARYRASRSVALRAGAGSYRYDAGDFAPWTGAAGVTWIPRDLWELDAGWERSHFDSILSFQDRVTQDRFALSATRSLRWRTELSAAAALLFQHNGNQDGQPRENDGYEVVLGARHPLYRKGETASVTGVARLSWLAFREDLDVGVFDPLRYTTEMAGAEGRWRVHPRWELFGTLLAGAQQEYGEAGAPLYELEAGADLSVGEGVVTLLLFSSDSSAGGTGGGFWRRGGSLRFRIPF